MSIDLSSLGQIKLKGAGTSTGTLTLNAPASLAGDRAISIYDPLVGCPLQLGAKRTVSVNAATVLTPAQSGTLVSLSKAAAYDITLPTPSAGLEFDFVQFDAAAANAVRIDAGAGLLVGSWINTVAGTLTGATTAGTAVRYYTFAAASVKGDTVRLVSDGVNWYARGMIGVAAGAAFA